MSSDDREQFLHERQKRFNATSVSDEVWILGEKFFNRATALGYSYNFDWLGVPIIQIPQDIIAIQEIIWKIKPDLIVETGIARGGSILFYASILKLVGNRGIVLGIDVDIRAHNRKTIEEHPVYDSKFIKLIEASSVSAEAVDTVRKFAEQAKKILVILDSNHTHEHVLKELELYSPFVSTESYLIVLDTIIDQLPAEIIGSRPWGHGNSPKSAVDQFLSKNHNFQIDRDIDAKLLISVGPAGYLKRIREK